MRRRIILLLIGIIVSITLVYGISRKRSEKARIGSQASLLNLSFEELNEAGKPKFWEESSEGGWFADVNEFYEGKISMGATVAWSWLWQEIPVEPKKFYKLKVHVKSDIKEEENTLLVLECLDKKGKTIARNYGVVSAFSFWQIKESSVLLPRAINKERP